LYFCGGELSYATTTRWFELGFDGGEHVDFTEDTWRVHAHLAGGRLAGEVRLGDEVTRWLSAEPVTSDTVAGLYEGKSSCGRVGLIITQNNKAMPPSAQGACTGTTVQPVTPDTPLSLESGAIKVRLAVTLKRPCCCRPRPWTPCEPAASSFHDDMWIEDEHLVFCGLT
jgi:hypothetical protein